MNKILLIGGTGFIGKHVLDALIDNNYSIDVVSRNFHDSDSKVKYIIGDILNHSFIENLFKENKYTECINLSWYCGPNYQISDINDLYYSAAINILHVFHKYGGKKILCTGSVFEYEISSELLTEQTILNSNIKYGKIKSDLYYYMKQYCNNNNIDFKWARIFNLFGPGENQKRLIPYIINSIKNNKKILLTANKIQDYIYVKDVADIIVKLFNSNISDAVNICSGKSIKLSEICTIIASIFNKKDIDISFLNKKSLINDEIIYGSNLKIINELKYNYKYDIQSGLQEYINDYF